MCGCKGKTNELDRAVMCLACPSRRGGLCKPAGVPIVATIRGLAVCPKGRHPDDNGVLTWAWIRWHGVPKVVRWAVRPWIGRDRIRRLKGCGCIVVLKKLWGRHGDDE